MSVDPLAKTYAEENLDAFMKKMGVRLKDMDVKPNFCRGCEGWRKGNGGRTQMPVTLRPPKERVDDMPDEEKLRKFKPKE